LKCNWYRSQESKEEIKEKKAEIKEEKKEVVKSAISKSGSTTNLMRILQSNPASKEVRANLSSSEVAVSSKPIAAEKTSNVVSHTENQIKPTVTAEHSGIKKTKVPERHMLSK
jgi:hypothetical protein